jgi:hypothetical protein
MLTPRKPLGDVAHIYVGLPTKQSDIRGAGRSGNVLTVRALTGIDINHDELVHVSLQSLRGRDRDKYRAAAGDVLISARSTSLKTAIVPANLDGTVINATLVGVRSRPALEPLLLLAYLQHPDGQMALAAVAQSATAQMNITVSALQSLLVPVPPIEVQHQLVRMLEASDEAYRASLEAANTRRQLAIQVIADRLKEGRVQ